MVDEVPEVGRLVPAGGEPAALREIVDTLGLSWWQMAELFAVSPRTVQRWAEGEPMNDANRKRLGVLLARTRSLVSNVPPGTPAGTLNVWLTESRPGEPSLFRRWCAEARRDEGPPFRLSDMLDVADGPSGVEPYEVIETRPMPEPTREL